VDAASPARDARADAAGMTDARVADARVFPDAPVADAALADAALAPPDAAIPDAPVVPDAVIPDAVIPDAAAPDAPPVDAAPLGGCISGASGTRAVRFRWDGNGPGSTAYVVYEANDLPDTSRWMVTAASTSFDYTPVFDDTFLAQGGLDLEDPAFVDVELSTVGLSSIRGVTIAVYGRSFDTTTSGSFTWQTFDDVGQTDPGSFPNSAPYQWTYGDATTAFSPGDDGVYLRLRAGPPSDALIMNTVEVCFDAD
jgi:hypothetical protein